METHRKSWGANRLKLFSSIIIFIYRWYQIVIQSTIYFSYPIATRVTLGEKESFIPPDVTLSFGVTDVINMNKFYKENIQRVRLLAVGDFRRYDEVNYFVKLERHFKTAWVMELPA